MSPSVKAYTYVRMSTDVQLKGHSLQRQRELAENYASAHGLELAEESIYQDLGVSAFRSTNLGSGGALGRFVKALQEGRIEQGSVLLVESLDRLSRDVSSAALRLFLEILDFRVDIVTLTDGHRYSHADVGTPDLMRSLIIMERAHEESAIKSKRLKASWDNKKSKIESGQKLTRNCPQWMKLSEDRRSFELIPERGGIVKSIFEDSVAGLGAELIARRLNEQKVRPWGNADGWHASYIKKILQGRTVLGELALHEVRDGVRVPTRSVADYYPSVISPVLYEKARAAQASRVNKGGRRGAQIANLVSGIVVCGYCLNRATLKDNGAEHGGRYLVCDRGRRGLGCTRSGTPYLDVEEALLQLVPEIDLASIVSVNGNNEKRTKLSEKLDQVTHQCNEHQRQIDALVDALTSRQSAPGAIVDRIALLEDELAEAVQKKIDTERALRQASQEIYSAGEYQNELKKFVAQIGSLSVDAKVIARASIQSRLRSLIKEIRLYPSGTRSSSDREKLVKFIEKNEEDAVLRQAFIDKFNEKQDRTFLVIFKSGRYIVVNPSTTDVAGMAYFWENKTVPEWAVGKGFDPKDSLGIAMRRTQNLP